MTTLLSHRLRRILFAGAMVVTACGGSSSETPFPEEPLPAYFKPNREDAEAPPPPATPTATTASPPTEPAVSSSRPEPQPAQSAPTAFPPTWGAEP